MIKNALSICDGLGTGKLALDALGINSRYLAYEINPTVRKLADSNNLGIERPKDHDLRSITPRYMLHDGPVFDYFLCGFTCTSLTVQGKRKGLDGESGIVFHCINLMLLALHRNPECKIIIENVSSMSNKTKAVLISLFKLHAIEINSALVSGQARKRIYFTNFRVSQPKDRSISALSVLEKDAQGLEARSRSTRYKDTNTGRVFSSPGPDRESYFEYRKRTDDKANTLVTGKGCQGPSTKNVVITKSGEERPLSVRECARLQTLPETYSFKAVSESAAYQALGKGWNLETIKHILAEAA